MISMPVGVVMRRKPGVTPWQKWSWKPVAVIPGAGPADWKLLREETEYTDFHAGTMAVELYRTDTAAYLEALNAPAPVVFVIMRDSDREHPFDVHQVTVSAFEAQDYTDSGEEMVEPVPMPEGMIAWVRDFVERHHEEEVFIKRKRDKKRVDDTQDGIGDNRVQQTTDVYRSPSSKRKGFLQ